MAIRTLPGRLAPSVPVQGGWRRLYCFPHSGAGAVVFAKWPDGLPSDVDVCVPCLPGRDARIDEPPCAEMPLLVSNLAQEMLPQLSTAYALYGHSMGAFIAFELALELSKHGHPPAHLFVSAQRGPKLPHPGKPIFALPEKQFLTAVLER